MAINLDPWQKEVLDYEGDLLLCTGRRVGKTYILARKAIDLMAKKPKTPIIMMSLTEDQAMIIISMALNYAKDTYPHLLGKGKDKPTLRSITLNKGKMIVRPMGATGDGARGFEGGVLIVDEAARAPPMFWIAALPVILTTGGQVWMGSTPFGMQGYFWKSYDEAVNKHDPKARFKVFSISTERAMSERAVSSTWTLEQKTKALATLEKDKRDMSVRQYAQEYLGMFIDELSRFFSDEVIERACVLQRPETITHKYKTYLGVDIARLGEDKSAYAIIQKIDQDNYIQVFSMAIGKQKTWQTEEKIIELDQNHHFDGIGIDAGSGTLGVSVLDHLLRIPSIAGRLEAMNNRARSLNRDENNKTQLAKEDYYDNLLSMMQRGHLKLLKDDDLINALRSIQYEIVITEDKRSRIRIFADPSPDLVEALHRAAYLANEDKRLRLWGR